nr:retrovirus-related Pol polyprotein from transposon TNT 1-94 [Tanacetum cinerariifolium]
NSYKLKDKAVLTEAVSLNPIDPELLKVDVTTFVPKLRKNTTAHTDYIRHTQEEAATLRKIVESERLLSPLNTSLVYAWVNLVSSASESLSQDNTKNNRIRQTQKKAKKNKVEDHLRTVKSSLNKASVVDSKATSYVRLKVPVRRIRTDNETEFVNQTLRDYYDEVGISHETSVARSPQQNGVVERRNRTLIEAARTMLIYAQAPLFLWAEAVATACFTQNRSIIRLRHKKTPYELLHSKLPDVSFFHVFGALCYPTNDSENLGKLQPKADIEIFIGYAPTKKAFRIYNRRTRRIVETMHVDFDELTAMAFEQRSSGPALNEMTPGTISSGLVPITSPSTLKKAQEKDKIGSKPDKNGKRSEAEKCQKQLQ